MPIFGGRGSVCRAGVKAHLARGLLLLLVGVPSVDGQDKDKLRKLRQSIRVELPSGFENQALRSLEQLEKGTVGSLERPHWPRGASGRSGGQVLERIVRKEEGEEEQAATKIPRVRSRDQEARRAEERESAEGSALAAGSEELSAFELQLLTYGDSLVKRPILQFGYEVFSQPAPVLVDTPIGADYVLGTGDNLVIAIWGATIDEDFHVAIDRDGQTRLPQIGPVALKGLTIRRAEESLRRAFDRLYKNYQLQLRMGKLRDMSIHVIGRVKRPGRVRVASVASLLDALTAAGGISKDGTLRRIRLRRVGAEDRIIDLYHYLLEGDLTVDVSLSPNDAIVVPAVGSRVAVAGRVLRPAIYELTEDRVDFYTVLSMAGGYGRLANRQALQIESVSENGLVVQTVDLERSPAHRVFLKNGDVAVVKNANPKLENVVYVTGNVAIPGRYALREGMRVSDLISEETLVEAGFWLRRRPPSAGEPTSKLPEPFLGYALIRRIDPRTKQEQRITFDLGKAILEKDPRENCLLQSQDTIIVFPRSAFETPVTVYISGAVNKPGKFRHFPGMRVNDLVRTAGGLLHEAHLPSALLTRLHADQEGAYFENFRVDLEAVRDGDADANILLQPDDSLAVKVVPDYRKVIRVTIEGEVRQPGSFTAIPGERLSDLLTRAGGYTKDAYLPATQFFRESVRILQEQRLEESLRRLELETKIVAEKLTAEASATGHDVDVHAEQRRVEKLIETIRGTPARGRMVVRLRDIDGLRGNEDDIELADGDRLVIPRQPQEVHVVGAVFNQTALFFKKGLTVRDYLQECGGTLDSADVDIAYVVRADGTADSARHARKHYRWDSKRGRYGRGDLLCMELYPGDTVIIPYDIKPKISKLGLTKTVAQILFQAVLSTGVIVALL